MEKDVEDGWVETFNPDAGKKNEDEQIMDLDDDEAPKQSVMESAGVIEAAGGMEMAGGMQVIGENPATAGTGGGGEDDIPDLDDLDDDNLFAQPA